MILDDVVFTGFNSRIAALNRETGEIIWEWRAHSGSGYVSLLLDGDRLIASVSGYTYCLETRTGREIWFNKMTGFGYGVASICSTRGSTGPMLLQKSDDSARRSQSASTNSATHG